MSSKPIIKPVGDNISKNKTYTVLMGNYAKAMESGFYGEAELIVYAYLEDQLKAFLYYSDGLDASNSRKVNENLEELLGQKQQIDNISDKIYVIRKILAKISDAEDKTDYIQFLRRVYKVSVDASGVKSLLKKIEKWYNYRNEIVHSMFHKDIDELRNGYKKHVEEGFEMARFLDNQVKSLRRA